jgi:hypothetical protein
MEVEGGVYLHPIKATNDQLLEEELGCDAEEQVHVQLIVVSLEWLRGSSASCLVHHRCLNLKEIAVVKIAEDIS